MFNNTVRDQPSEGLPCSNFTVDLEKASHVWGRQFSSPADLFTLKTILPNGKVIPSSSLMLGQDEANLCFVAYDNKKEYRQDDVVRFLSPDEIAISIKHHGPAPEEKEMMKLQCTHIQMVVGVMVDGNSGAITVNNPRAYEGGLFGNASYPMIFIKPIFPETLSQDRIQEYTDNIRTWLVIANAFTQFPPNYDGGDALATRSVGQVRILGDWLLQALAGDESAVQWLHQPGNRVYCAELAHVALNLGLYYPLNKKILGEERFQMLKQAIEMKDFLNNHENPYIKLITLKTAPETLNPISEILNNRVTEPEAGEPFGCGLAIQPFTAADILEEFVQEIIPRSQIGEALAPVQAQVLEKAKESFFTAIGLSQLPSDNTKRKPAETIYREIVKVVGQSYENYEVFRQGLEPVLAEARKIVSPRDDGVGAFVPPHCYLIRATDSIRGKSVQGVLRWRYMGHGLHESILKKIR